MRTFNYWVDWVLLVGAAGKKTQHVCRRVHTQVSTLNHATRSARGASVVSANNKQRQASIDVIVDIKSEFRRTAGTG
jgi:hypothetical protein